MQGLQANSDNSGSDSRTDSSDRNDSAWKAALTGIVASLLYGACTIVSVERWLTPTFLYEDDAIFLPRAADALASTSRRADILLTNSVTEHGSIFTAKVVSLGAAAAIAGLLAAVLALATRRWLLSTSAALAVSFYPVSLAPGIFVLGSHPFYAGPVAIAAVLTFWRGWVHTRRHSVVAVATTAVLATLAASLSPTAMLMAVMPFLAVIMASISHWPGRIQFLAASIVSVIPPVTLPVLGLASYHYQQMEGWVDISLGQIFANASLFSRMVFDPITRAGPLTNWLYVFALVAAVCITVATAGKRWLGQSSPNTRFHRLTRETPLPYMLLTGALAFGPGSVVTAYNQRYAALPFLFVGSAVALGLVLLVQGDSPKIRGAIVAAFLLFAGVSALRAHSMRIEEYGSHLSSHRYLEELAATESSKWEFAAQVVVVMPSDFDIPTFGFNHWSTWYLRNLSERSDIIGLVGRSEWLDRAPFVEEYRDHDSEYWTVTAGRTTRAQMKGIVSRRPLYVYEVLVDGSIQRRDVAFVGPNDAHFVKHGNRFTNQDRPCETVGSEPPLVWPVDGRAEPSSEVRIVSDDSTWHFDDQESATVNVAVAPGAPVRIRLRFSSAENVRVDDYTETLPPMPLITDSFAVYEKPDGFAIFDRDAQTQWFIDSVGGVADVWLEGREGCFIVIRNESGSTLGALSRRTVSGEWNLGRGFLNRYWRGSITASGEEFRPSN